MIVSLVELNMNLNSIIDKIKAVRVRLFFFFLVETNRKTKNKKSLFF